MHGIRKQKSTILFFNIWGLYKKYKNSQVFKLITISNKVFDLWYDSSERCLKYFYGYRGENVENRCSKGPQYHFSKTSTPGKPNWKAKASLVSLHRTTVFFSLFGIVVLCDSIKDHLKEGQQTCLSVCLPKCVLDSAPSLINHVTREVNQFTPCPWNAGGWAIQYELRLYKSSPRKLNTRNRKIMKQKDLISLTSRVKKTALVELLVLQRVYTANPNTDSLIRP